MAVLILSAVLGAFYSLGMAFVCSKSYFALLSNKPFTKGWPEIDPPLWRVALKHIAGLLSTVLWLVQWPSVTEVGMALCLVPLLFVPFPAILNNLLEWFMFLIFGNAKGDGSHKDGDNGAPPLRWPPSNIATGLVEAVSAAVGTVYAWHRMMWHGRSPEETLSAENAVNCNHSLMCYLQNESWDEMHHLDEGVLGEFPSSSPSSRSNAVMMARCATMSYDRWHNIDQAVSCRWNKGSSKKYSLLTAWSFDRVTVPSDLEAKVCDTVTAPYAPLATGSANTNGTSSMAAFAGTPRQDKVSLTIRLKKLLVALQCYVTSCKTCATQSFLNFWQAVWWWLAGKPGVPDKPVFNGDETTAINTDAYLVRADKVDPATGGKEVALVLAFRGTEALQTVDWISDLNLVTPPPTAKDPAHFPMGFTHQGFRDSLGLKKNLHGAEDLPGFSGSYLVYKPSNSEAGSAAGGTSSAGWKMGTMARVNPDKSLSPFTIISTALDQTITDIKAELGPSTKVKVFVTGHSLGGALAHLYSGTLLLAKQPNGRPTYSAAVNFEAVYTFGEPRVGDQVWVENVEDALRTVACGDFKAEDRFKRVVNTLDIVTRIPPPLGDVYQHPGHCTLIKPHFAIAKGPAGVPDCACTLSKMAEAAGVDTSFSPIVRLTENPEIFLWPTVTTVLVKLAVSVLLLASSVVLWIAKECSVTVLYLLAAMAAAVALVPGALVAAGISGMALLAVVVGLATFIFLPGLYDAVLDPVLQQAGRSLFMLVTSIVQPLKERPRLVSNPIYVITRLLALLGPGPVVLLLDALLLPAVVVNPLLWWTVPVEVVLVLLLFAVMPPFIIGGLVDHSMAEYYTACWVSKDTDWKSTPGRPKL